MAVIKTWLTALARRPSFWKVMSPFFKAVDHMQQVRSNDEYAVRHASELKLYLERFSHIVRDRTVLHGPFKGMKYPSYHSYGSALYSKLLGSYESEIHNIIREICTRQYASIVNIGCGEGYYAVGLALSIPAARVYAFDISDDARRYTNDMATLNNVRDRMEIGSNVSREFFGEISQDGKGLIVCDCEGCELSLFQASGIENFRNTDLLIETHDFIDINISTRLQKIFATTHTCSVVTSIDDLEKAKTYNFEESATFDLETKRILFGEGRPSIMEWLFLQPKGEPV
jgi:hypothetical protein